VLRARTGQSEQFPFFKNDRIIRKDDELPRNPLVDMRPGWNKKAAVPQVQASLKNTHTNLFTQLPPKVDAYRVQRLIDGE